MLKENGEKTGGGPRLANIGTALAAAAQPVGEEDDRLGTFARRIK